MEMMDGWLEVSFIDLDLFVEIILKQFHVIYQD